MDPRPALDGLRLLLVEDEFVLALGISDVLVDAGADVLGPVGAVDDALKLVEQIPEIDVAVLDVNLAGETIYPVADALRARAVPFLFASANDRAQLPARFADVPLCRKPFDASALREALDALLAAATPPPA